MSRDCLINCCLIALSLVLAFSPTTHADDPAPARPKRLLLLTQGPDGHPKGTHEYRSGQQILKQLLSTTPNLEVTLVEADADWQGAPEALAKADAAVLFLSEGAKWLSAEPRRLEAFARFAERGGGLSAIHWATGTREKEPVAPFVELFGACHGGPDRKYKVLEAPLHIAAENHPATAGLEDFRQKDEFYYQLKTVRDAKNLTPLVEAEIDGQRHTVAWAWQREGGGRSFGFTGLHFHENWLQPNYQRLIAQGVLWTLDINPPKTNFPAEID